MSVVDDLKAAREIVAARWHKGSLTDYCGNVCAAGALNEAISGDVMGIFYMNGDPVDTEWIVRRAEAQESLEIRLPREYRTLPAFNDADTTTKQDVLNLFDKTLADLGGLA